MPDVRFDGADEAGIWFAVESRSRKGLWHDVWIERHGRWKGSIICRCEHCQFKRATGHVLDGGVGCWHIRQVEEAIAWAVSEMEAA